MEVGNQPDREDGGRDNHKGKGTRPGSKTCLDRRPTVLQDPWISQRSAS